MRLAITNPKTDPQILEWDSEFFGVRIARTDHPDVTQWAIDNTVGCVCLLLDADDTEGVHDAEARGFRLMDVRVTLEAKGGVDRPYAVPVTPDEVETIAQLARRSHRITRFYADPRFDNERCDDLYESWLRNSVAGWADAVCVVGPLGEPVGYVTVHVDGESSSLGLIAVDERARNRGHGLELVRAALWEAWARGANRMTVVTQGRNVAAQRVFQRAGFVTTSTQLWFHRWTDQ